MGLISLKGSEAGLFKSRLFLENECNQKVGQGIRFHYRWVSFLFQKWLSTTPVTFNLNGKKVTRYLNTASLNNWVKINADQDVQKSAYPDVASKIQKVCAEHFAYTFNEHELEVINDEATPLLLFGFQGEKFRVLRRTKRHEIIVKVSKAIYDKLTKADDPWQVSD